MLTTATLKFENIKHWFNYYSPYNIITVLPVLIHWATLHQCTIEIACMMT